MPDAPPEHRQLAAIMFTDMVDYSALAQRDQVLALELLEEHRQIVRSFSSASTAPKSKLSAMHFWSNSTAPSKLRSAQ